MTTIALTGSASGIGAACAARLAAQGHGVIGVDQRDADIVADLGTAAGRQQAIDGIAERCGGALDGLVACAGISGAFDRAGGIVVAVNYFGTVELLSGLRPHLAAGTDAAAVAVSSNSTTTQPGVPVGVIDACLDGDEDRARVLADEAGSVAVYPATKIAIARWVRRNATRPEWAGAGIRLNAVAPGVTWTPMVQALVSDPAIGKGIEAFPVPLDRAGRPEEIAAVITFLLGPEASFVCGSVVFADGGTDALLRPDDWPAPWTNEAARTFFESLES
ncbi:MAG: SDR family oxidoreductase [Actinomycetota bacterium]